MSKATQSRMTGYLRNPRVWLGVVIAVVVIAFIVQNRDPVVSSLFTLNFTAPAWLTLTVVFVLGLLTGWLTARRR